MWQDPRGGRLQIGRCGWACDVTHERASGDHLVSMFIRQDDGEGTTRMLWSQGVKR